MKLLFVSNLFPDSSSPVRGLDNASLLHRLSAHCEVRVFAPRPTRGIPPLWFPKHHDGRAQDQRLRPIFPPVPYVPKIGSRINHRLMAHALRPRVQEIRVGFPFDMVLSSWLYPDACAVSLLGREMQFPFVAIAQGSDVHQYLAMPVRRHAILTAMRRAKAVVTRSQELARLLNEAGLPPEKVHPILNGVDVSLFHAADRQAVRARLGIPRATPVLLFVGNLLPIKNPLLLVAAHARMASAGPGQSPLLFMIGTGPLESAVGLHARQAGTADRVRLLGSKSPPEVASYMQAADLLCLPSVNEGVPNVVLEALACGLPVVASNVGGLPEVIAADFLGRLVVPDDAAAFAQALSLALVTAWDRDQISDFARRFSWKVTVAAYLELLNSSR